MKNHLKILLPCLMAALALLCFIPRQASAQEGLGASRACAGHTLGAVNGCPACMEGENLHICENNFSDANFRGYLIDDLFDSDLVPVEQVNNQTGIDCSDKEIASMKGVEYFGALERLSCHFNQLTGLNVRQNPALVYLSCCSNQLTSLDVSQNPALKSLYCFSNPLTSLDVSQNPVLEELSCYSNQLTSLDVSQNQALERLDCSSNQLTSLDVSQNPALEHLYCDSNQLTSLDVSKNPALEHLSCFYNQLTSLDVSQNPALKHLSCGANQLTSLDVSQNPALEALECYSNQLTSLDVSQNPALEHLYCGSNQLTSLDVSQNPALELLSCGANFQLTSLDVSGCTALADFWCDYNQLTSLDVSQNTALKRLYCDSNQLTSLDLSQNPALEELSCRSNQLTNLDVSQNQALEKLYCDSNKLTSLDLSNNISLTRVDLYQYATLRTVDTYAVDLKLLVEEDKLNRIVSVEGGSFDPSTGIVSLEEGVTRFTYYYDTQNEEAGNMTVSVVPMITITYDFGEYVAREPAGYDSEWNRLYYLYHEPKVVETGIGQKVSVSNSLFWLESEDGEYYVTYWKIKGDTSGKLYAHGEIFTPYEDTVFEADWRKKCLFTVETKYENNISSFGKNAVLDEGLAGYSQKKTVNVAYNTPYVPDLDNYNTSSILTLKYILDSNTNEIIAEIRGVGIRGTDGFDNCVYRGESYINGERLEGDAIIPQGDRTFCVAWNLGWNRYHGRNWYYMEDNTFPVSCFKEIDGETYYFDELGFAVTGIYEVEGKQYLFDEDGVLIGDIIPPSADALKEAADVSDDSTDVIMDVEKQEGEANPADVEKIGKEVGEGFEVVSAFDIKLFSVVYDAEGKEVSREPITQLNQPVLLTFATPGEAGKTYQVVRMHINEKGEVEVTLLPTTDNGDGTVSVESDRFSMYYLAAVDDKAYKPGDINGDGKVNIFDVIRLLKKVTGESVETFANTDVNHDGKVNIFDVIRLLKYVTGEQVEVH